MLETDAERELREIRNRCDYELRQARFNHELEVSRLVREIETRDWTIDLLLRYGL